MRWADDFAQMAEVAMVAFLVGGSFLSLGYYDYEFAILIAVAATRSILEINARGVQRSSSEPSSGAIAATWRHRNVAQ